MTTEIAVSARGPRRRVGRRALSVLLLLAGLGPHYPRLASAQSVAPKAEARAHFDRGLRLLDRGELEAAAAEFEVANSLLPTALAAYNAALANARLGRPSASVRLLRASLEHAPSRELGAKVEVLLDEQSARVGTLLVRVVDLDGSSVDEAEVTSPGAQAPLLVGQAVEFDPGPHTLSITAPGRARFERTVMIVAGTRQELVLIVEHAGSPPPSPLESDATTVRPEPPAVPPNSVPLVPRVMSASPRSARTSSLSTIGVITASAGASIVLVAGAVLWHADRGFAELAPQVEAFNASTAPGAACSPGKDVSACRSHSDELNQRHADLKRERIFGAVGLGLGATVVMTGIAIWLNARATRTSTASHLPVEFLLSPGGASFVARGTF